MSAETFYVGDSDNKGSGAVEYSLTAIAKFLEIQAPVCGGANANLFRCDVAGTELAITAGTSYNI